LHRAIRARRLRTKAGEIDAVAEKDGILAIVEVKSRPTLAEAASCLTVRQQSRLLGACEIVLAQHPDWGINGVRFDVLVVNPAGQVRRIADAFRLGDFPS
jgi:putative endonuclease